MHKQILADGAGAEQTPTYAAFTAELIPAAKNNVWSFIFSDRKALSYRLVREAEKRRFRVEFDLTKPLAVPPAPWGHR